MVRQLNKKEILDKVDEIVKFIKDTKEYQNYVKAKKLLEEDKELNKLINEIKEYQKSIVRGLNKKELEAKIQENLDKLNSSPLYLEYNNNLAEVNNLIVIFENKINKYFEDVFNQVGL